MLRLALATGARRCTTYSMTSTTVRHASYFKVFDKMLPAEEARPSLDLSPIEDLHERIVKVASGVTEVQGKAEDLSLGNNAVKLKVLLAIETELGVGIGNQDLGRLKTLGDVIEHYDINTHVGPTYCAQKVSDIEDAELPPNVVWVDRPRPGENNDL
eukprot:TRINITY_DN4762_c0_g1_i1.p1 TRINITY_DN4762_c0_g1~~TRINITY_DN4762_c0_g1_i1.p1  ORF type:complete len:157 (+),score=21.86 TRINITY_DN4762_c0_g1_i1:160-630(+)